MHSFGPEILFSDHEQRLGLPPSIPRKNALERAYSLIDDALELQTQDVRQFEAHRLDRLNSMSQDIFEPLPDISDRVFSPDAYQLYAAGRRLAELAAPEVAAVVETYLRGQAEA